MTAEENQIQEEEREEEGEMNEKDCLCTQPGTGNGERDSISFA